MELLLLRQLNKKYNGQSIVPQLEISHDAGSLLSALNSWLEKMALAKVIVNIFSILMVA